MCTSDFQELNIVKQLFLTTFGKKSEWNSFTGKIHKYTVKVELYHCRLFLCILYKRNNGSSEYLWHYDSFVRPFRDKGKLKLLFKQMKGTMWDRLFRRMPTPPP